MNSFIEMNSQINSFIKLTKTVSAVKITSAHPNYSLKRFSPEKSVKASIM